MREEIIRRVRTLKKERNFISTLLDTADALVVALDQKGRIVHFNRACEQISGYSLAEIKNRHVWELLPPEAAKAVERYFTNSPLKPSEDISGRLQSKFEAYLNPKTGPQRLIAWSNATLLDKAGAVEYVIATGIDITEQRQAEAAMRESEERFKKLFEFAPDAYYLNDLDGRLIDCNRAAEEMTGYQKEAFIGQSFFELNLLSEQELPKAMAALAKGVRGEPTGPDEFALIRKDGSQVMVEIRSFPVEIKDQRVILGIARDITERKQIEEALRQQNEQLQARNRELDAYARTVAHDLKNPIGTLTTMSQVLAEVYSTMPPEDLGEYLQSMARSSQKANRIVEGLLLLAGVRQRTVAIRAINMANIVAETLASMADMIEACQAEIITPSEWPTILGYAPWLEEVWSNYISNGLKYGSQPPRLELGSEVQADGMARFWVKDNGPGLSTEAQARLFTEFTQLEPDRLDSYGLGLSIVRRIVERLGGQVGVESEGQPGQGSTFSFTLPLA